MAYKLYKNFKIFLGQSKNYEGGNFYHMSIVKSDDSYYIMLDTSIRAKYHTGTRFYTSTSKAVIECERIIDDTTYQPSNRVKAVTALIEIVNSSFTGIELKSDDSFVNAQTNEEYIKGLRLLVNMIESLGNAEND